MNEYEKALHFLEVGCGCGCSAKEEFAVLREDFQALTKPEQDTFLMAQLRSMDGGANSTSRRLKNKTRVNKRTKSLAQEWTSTTATAVKNFLLNYAEVHGLPSPVRNVNRVTQSIVFLPAEMSYRSVHRDFLAGLEEESKLRAFKYDAFRKLWHQLTPYIQIMSSRTDLCDTCQQLRNDLQFKARKEEEAQEHLVKAKKLVDQDYSILKGKTPYRSINAIGKVYYLSARKVHLFGIQDEAVREQINYVIDENELLGKGPNGTLSLVFDGIKQLNKGEKHLKITCDNAGGQNKNNTTLWFYLYLAIVGYYESIELNFMVPGHTKFKCDGSFGPIKRLYRKTTVDCVDHIADVVKRSSIAGLNKARRYNGDEGFQYYDIISGLETYFKKLPGLQRFQHFLFTCANPGIVKAQEVANGPFQEFKLLKISKSEASRVIEGLVISSASASSYEV
ncbi:8269_t:CDS:2 [Ambispora leptoticha]|uniref:8269_t:CDS:1 n=1 Tax=Ambispora leptoticha TaxID=144679 RepID=A0A9N9FW36_9GLOM|nr:8269_t:CDS:2 [Ambispora leptoticha]